MPYSKADCCILEFAAQKIRTGHLKKKLNILFFKKAFNTSDTNGIFF